MGLEKIKQGLKNLNHKDAEKANKLIKDEEWDELLIFINTIIDDANVDVVLAAEEDNGQLVREKSETLDALMKLKFSIEDYIDEYLDDNYYDD